MSENELADYSDEDVSRRFGDVLVEMVRLIKEHRNNPQALVDLPIPKKKEILLKIRKYVV